MQKSDNLPSVSHAALAAMVVGETRVFSGPDPVYEQKKVSVAVSQRGGSFRTRTVGLVDWDAGTFTKVLLVTCDVQLRRKKKTGAEKYTESTRLQAIRDYQNGIPVADISAATNVSASNIRQWLRDANVFANRNKRVRVAKPATESVRNEAVARARNGESVPEIARSIGYGEASVYRWIRADKGEAP